MNDLWYCNDLVSFAMALDKILFGSNIVGPQYWTITGHELRSPSGNLQRVMSSELDKMLRRESDDYLY
jgi:hypothetical protein